VEVKPATRLGVAMLAPAVLYIAALVGLPLVLAFVYAVGDVKVGSVGYHFVGLENFTSVSATPSSSPSRRRSSPSWAPTPWPWRSATGSAAGASSGS
jgi:ABC-type sugar transport system permease subunit